MAATPITEQMEFPTQRRPGFSSEPMSLNDFSTKSMVIPKSDSARVSIERALKGNFLFSSLSAANLKEMVDAMDDIEISAGHKVIVEGDEGDYFYVVESGDFLVFAPDLKGGPRPLGAWTSFGELALLFNQPRSATVIAQTEAKLWRLDRLTFRKIMMQSAVQKTQRYGDFLKSVKLFQVLNQVMLLRMIDALQPVQFNEGDIIIKQGEPGDEFFVIEEGFAEVYIMKEGQSVLVRELGTGAYFGEMAIKEGGVRTATIVAVKGPVSCLKLDRDAFARLLGPCDQIFDEEISKYQFS